MTNNTEKSNIEEFKEEGCDIRTWSEECKHSNYTSSGDKYVCVTCGKIHSLDHEVRHEGFPHVSGDYDNLS